MYKLLICDNFSAKLYDIEEKQDILKLANEYGKGNYKVALINKEGILSACIWSIEKQRYIKTKV